MAKSNQATAAVLKSLMKEYQLSSLSLSREIKLSPSMVNQLVSGKSKLSIPIVLRLSKFFGTTPAYWLDLQRKMLLLEAKKDKKLTAILKGISKVKKPAAKANAKPTAKAKPKKKVTLSDKRKKAAKVPGAKSAARKPRSK